MKTIICLSLLLAAGAAQAAPLDPPTIADTISAVAANARYGTAVSFNKTISGVLFVPYPSLHSADGQTEYAAIGVGVDINKGIKGTAFHGSPLVLPLVSVTGIASKITSGKVSQYLTFTDLGINVELGIGVNPLPLADTDGNWIIKNQVEGIAAITKKFGAKPLPQPS